MRKSDEASYKLLAIVVADGGQRAEHNLHQPVRLHLKPCKPEAVELQAEADYEAVRTRVEAFMLRTCRSQLDANIFAAKDRR